MTMCKKKSAEVIFMSSSMDLSNNDLDNKLVLINDDCSLYPCYHICVQINVVFNHLIVHMWKIRDKRAVILA